MIISTGWAIIDYNFQQGKETQVAVAQYNFKLGIIYVFTFYGINVILIVLYNGFVKALTFGCVDCGVEVL